MRALALAIVCVLAIVACTVSRPTDEFSCSTDTDCTGGRRCQGGFCVVSDASNCPSGCTTCNTTVKTCTMDCTSSKSCGGLSCPQGYTCNINCTGADACGNITCPATTKCTVTCLGGDSACGNITCRDACKCDVNCDSSACGSLQCPINDNGDRCTTDGSVGSPCVSSAVGCTKC